jgi:hypothetical protein
MVFKAPVLTGRDVIQAKAKAPARRAAAAAAGTRATDPAVLRERASRLGHRLERSMIVQAKLAMDTMEGEHELGADRVAREVVRSIRAAPVQATSAGDGGGYGDLVEAAQEKRAPQRLDATGIPATVRAKMEAAFAADFSGVRVHPGSARAAALGAVAYTQGSDIHVAPGHWAPYATRGQELLGHELAHVVQQRTGRVLTTAQIKGVALNQDPALEAEADTMGKRAAQGQSGGRGHVPTGRQDPLTQGAVQQKGGFGFQMGAPPNGMTRSMGGVIQAFGLHHYLFMSDDQLAAEIRNKVDMSNIAIEAPEGQRLLNRLERLVEKKLLTPKEIGQYKKIANRAVEDISDEDEKRNWMANGRTANKGKLYLGSAKAISEKIKAISKKTKDSSKRVARETRQLNVVPSAKWTWQINSAWMNSGVDSKSRFRLLLTDNAPIPDELGRLLASGVDSNTFLNKVYEMYGENNTRSDFWHSEDERFTWFSEELAELLEKGYVLVPKNKKPGKLFMVHKDTAQEQP